MSNLDLATALDVVRRTAAAAESQDQHLAIVVVDRAGQIRASACMDKASPVLLDLARRKAVTSATFGAPLSALAQFMGSDPLIHAGLTSDANLLILPGASPIMAEAGMMGALGVAGGHYDADQALVDAVLASQVSTEGASL